MATRRDHTRSRVFKTGSSCYLFRCVFKQPSFARPASVERSNPAAHTNLYIDRVTSSHCDNDRRIFVFNSGRERRVS